MTEPGLYFPLSLFFILKEKILNRDIKISEYNYNLPEQRIAKFPLEQRDASKLLVYRKENISEKTFRDIGEELPEGALLVFNNTKVIRARIIMHKPTGARIEIFCLEPHNPSDYERAFAIKNSCEWKCIIGNSRRWKDGPVEISFEYKGELYKIEAYRVVSEVGEQIVRFEWSVDLTFGQLLEHLGRIPIPPYLNRESEEIDNSRYQTVYSKFEGSVAAPTAGLHFTQPLIDGLKSDGVEFDEVTLHVGAGTFLPVKESDVTKHTMHTEHFEVTQSMLRNLIAHKNKIVAVGTTTVRTLESLPALGYRIMQNGKPCAETAIGQWELYDIPSELEGVDLLRELLKYMEGNEMDSLKTATRIMIMPGFKFRVADVVITNFHQPQSTLLLLVSAFIGDNWQNVYNFALNNNFRFLSYGDSSILIP